MSPTFHLEVLVEERSAEALLVHLLPKLLGDDTTFDIRVYNGKQDLLKKLPARLRGYSHSIDDTGTRIVVLVDEDRQDCRALKQQLEDAAAEAGLTTKTSAPPGAPFVVLTRVAVEELEAWLFGDVEAIRTAYPRVPTHLANQRGFRDPDAIAGGTCEQFERVLKRAGYHRGGLPKIAAANNIAPHMEPGRNRSGSFRHFVTGLEALLSA